MASISKLNLGGILLENLHLGENRINKMYLGDILIYEWETSTQNDYIVYLPEAEELQVLNIVESYDEPTETYTISNITINYDSTNEKLNIGGNE